MIYWVKNIKTRAMLFEFKDLYEQLIKENKYKIQQKELKKKRVY